MNPSVHAKQASKIQNGNVFVDTTIIGIDVI